MVDAVVGGSVEDPLQRPAVLHQLGVDPKLEQEVELQVHQQGRERHAQKGQGLVDTEGEILLERRLTESSGEVVLLGRMVDLVVCPNQVNLWKGEAKYRL